MKKQSAGRRVRREKIRRKKMQVREKVGKSRNTVFFRGFVAPEGWKVGSLKRRVRRHLGRWEMKSCTPLWREANFEVKRYKTPQRRTTLEVEVSKKCTPLWREAHFQVKIYKTPHVRATFGGSDVEKVHAVVARSTFPSQNVQNTPCTDLLEVQMRNGLWTLSRVSKTWGFCSIFNYNHHYTTLHSNTLHYTTTTTTPSLHSTTLHSTTLQCTQLHSSTLHYTTLHYTTLHYTILHYTTLHYTTLHYTTFHYTTLHYTTLHSTTLQLQLHKITLHYTTLHYTTFHYTPLHYTTLHYTTLQWMTLHHR